MWDTLIQVTCIHTLGQRGPPVRLDCFLGSNKRALGDICTGKCPGENVEFDVSWQASTSSISYALDSKSSHGDAMDTMKV